ncbi:MAG: FAD-dependent oxidoreductase [bacterium]
MSKSTKVIIAGAGLTGLSTAYHLQLAGRGKDSLSCEVFEASKVAGGLCASVKKDGFTFDYTGHILHLRNDYTRKLARELLRNNYKSHRRNSWIFSKDTYTQYPFQANTYGLPTSVIKECVLGFVQAMCSSRKSTSPKRNSFYGWIMTTFGAGIARNFMIPYNQKLWTVHPRFLTCDWMGGFVPRPSLEEVLRGALGHQEKSFGYNADFIYPKEEGIKALPDAFLERIPPVRFNSEITSIDIKKKLIEVNKRNMYEFDKFVSTLPLPELITRIKRVPARVKKAAGLLRCNSVLNINLGVTRKGISDKHWVYFPEKDYLFYRVGFPMNFAPSLVPRGASSLYTEIAYNSHASKFIPGSRYRLPGDLGKVIRKVKQDLVKAGILKSSDKIITTNVLDIKHAYVLYDKNRNKSVDIIMKFLNDNDICSVGRYGGWQYLTMEDAILEGRRVAGMLAL